MNTLVVLPAMSQILDAAKLLESEGLKFTPEQIKALVSICANALARDIELIGDEIEAINAGILADLPAASRAIN